MNFWRNFEIFIAPLGKNKIFVIEFWMIASSNQIHAAHSFQWATLWINIATLPRNYSLRVCLKSHWLALLQLWNILWLNKADGRASSITHISRLKKLAWMSTPEQRLIAFGKRETSSFLWVHDEYMYSCAFACALVTHLAPLGLYQVSQGLN